MMSTMQLGMFSRHRFNAASCNTGFRAAGRRLFIAIGWWIYVIGANRGNRSRSMSLCASRVSILPRR